jgi:hypothetical protein
LLDVTFENSGGYLVINKAKRKIHNGYYHCEIELTNSQKIKSTPLTIDINCIFEYNKLS